MPTENRSNTEKMAILPIWVIDRIKEEMKLGPAAWDAINEAVDRAETPEVLGCDVKIAPGTVFAKGTPVPSLLMAIKLREKMADAVFAQDAAQHQGERVYQVSNGVNGWDDVDLLRYTACSLNPEEYEVRMLYANPAPADSGEVERLRAEVQHLKSDLRIANDTVALGVKMLAEQEALLRELVKSRYWGSQLVEIKESLSIRIDSLLSTSAEPSAPKCKTCQGYGVIGWTRGRTPEQFEQGDSPCEDCNATGIAPADIDEEAELAAFQRAGWVKSETAAWLGWKTRAALERKSR